MVQQNQRKQHNRRHKKKCEKNYETSRRKDNKPLRRNSITFETKTDTGQSEQERTNRTNRDQPIKPDS